MSSGMPPSPPISESDPAKPSMFSFGKGMTRSETLATFARAPFSTQLQRLTTHALPSSDELTLRISSRSTPDALCEISSIATDAEKWIRNTRLVLEGLDAEDDVEWAGQGKDGFVGVEAQVGRFNMLLSTYLSVSLTVLERPDVRPSPGFGEAPSSSSQENPAGPLLDRLDALSQSFQDLLVIHGRIKQQVDIALEWTEVSQTLSEIDSELIRCDTLIFELEEARHIPPPSPSLDVNSLEALVAVNDGRRRTGSGTRHARTASLATLPTQTSAPLTRLEGLMAPLRASLSFLTPRLSSFTTRATNIFPSAVKALQDRKHGVEKRWGKLEGTVERVREELGEDQWVVVFRAAGGQCSDMISSILRTLGRLQLSAEEGSGSGSWDRETLLSWQGKREGYVPAIPRVLAVIEKGIRDRLTVNGEVLRLYEGLKQEWEKLEGEVREMDRVLEEEDAFGTLKSSEREPEVEPPRKGRMEELRGEGSRTPGKNGEEMMVAAEGWDSTPPSQLKVPLPRREAAIPIPRPTPFSQRRVVSHNGYGGETPRRGSTSNASASVVSTSTPSLRSGVTSPTPSTMGGRRFEGGLIPLTARPRWNVSPKAGVLAESVSSSPTPTSKLGRLGGMRSVSVSSGTEVSPSRLAMPPPAAPRSVRRTSGIPRVVTPSALPKPTTSAPSTPKLGVPRTLGTGVCSTPGIAVVRSTPERDRRASDIGGSPVRRLSGIPTPKRRVSEIPPPPGRRVSGIPVPGTGGCTPRRAGSALGMGMSDVGEAAAGSRLAAAAVGSATSSPVKRPMSRVGGVSSGVGTPRRPGSSLGSAKTAPSTPGTTPGTAAGLKTPVVGTPSTARRTSGIPMPVGTPARSMSRLRGNEGEKEKALPKWK
ncbi:KAR9-domain-containing protein [Saitoella complicata NRRL Y-17804]|uniref:KAR9-domain-containing protein n=1 Tax=Saitoella complicata (strain BCRC 22490 / CBS 7301 / JCM 7358 / NBRC 10748 / NRRL Y-17804) TaxID=698492 RepID=UPI0008675DE6|nr:KAR9-domain-containing protein [Saitoella complicata NRRL Y-17804]ODQ50051.1 KAR9-domain-containing protein [Saitoella complicata NRRL Y-17804]